MKTKSVSFILAIVILFLISSSQSVFSASRVRPEMRRKKVFRKGFYCLYSRRRDKAIAEFRKVADSHKGTEIGANALLLVAYHQKRIDAIETLKELKRDYPNTRYEFIAKLGIIGRTIDFVKHPLLSKQKEREVVTAIGGVGIDSIANGNAQWFDPKTVESKYRNDLAMYYYLAGFSYYEKQYQKSLRILIFIRNKFPNYKWHNIHGSIREVVWDMNGITNTVGYPKDTRPPTVWIIQPRPKVLLFRRRPWIYIKMFDGDISQSQIDLPKMVFTLDGQDLTNDMKVRSKINKSGRVHKRRPWKHPFEVLKIRYRPKRKLTPGKHTIYIKVPDGLGHVTEKTWTFRVKKGCRHPDDDKDDDEAPPEE